MTQFQFDTSGVVRFDGGTLGYISWEGLGALPNRPFMQGYIKAMAQDVFFAFHMLAPETLARIMEDCAVGRTYQWTLVSEHMMGVSFWRNRQQGDYGPTFPPLTVALNDLALIVFL